MCPDVHDEKEGITPWRIVRWKDRVVEWEVDPEHRIVIFEYFGFPKGHSNGLSENGDIYRPENADFNREQVDDHEEIVFRGLVRWIKSRPNIVPNSNTVSR